MKFLIFPLLGLLVAAVISFAAIGLAHVRRRRSLARGAHESSLRFAPDDPLDIPHRYRDFSIIHHGHSPRATNVTFGNRDNLGVRAFDFNYELGHGARRITRRCSVVVVVELEKPLDDLLMWNDLDKEYCPIEARGEQGHLGCWSCSGSARLAGVIVQACAPMAQAGVSIEVRGCRVLICLPALAAWPQRQLAMDTAVAAAKAGAEFMAAQARNG